MFKKLPHPTPTAERRCADCCEDILIDAKTAAKRLGISRSQFDAKVRAGVLPPPIRVLGRPLWWAVGATPPMAVWGRLWRDDMVSPEPAPLPKDEWKTEL